MVLDLALEVNASASGDPSRPGTVDVYSIEDGTGWRSLGHDGLFHDVA